MKKIAFLVFGIIIGSFSMFFYNYLTNSNDSYENVNNNEVIRYNDTISMMLETEAGSGNYEMTTANGWPTDGYVFNTILSKCENGGELSWDDENKRVLMSGNVSDRCYVYFDKIMTLSEFVIAQYNGVQGNNNIYYHDSTLENGAGDNSYRYAGSSDTTNNYVCFGSDAATCPEDNLYRMIGVFDGQVKLIKATEASSSLLGTNGACGYSNGYGNLYYWSTLNSCPSSTTGYINDNSNNAMFVSNRKNSLAAGNPDADRYCNLWKYSTLNTINLNTNFLTNTGSKWTELIVDTVWKIGEYNTNSVTPSVFYAAEVEKATETYGPSDGISKIGLIYVSDFGFAASPSAWTTTMASYRNFNDVNWLSLIDSWTITHNLSNDTEVFSVSNGILYYTGNVAVTGQKRYVYPVFYLLSSVAYSSGDGTKDSPIRIN